MTRLAIRSIKRPAILLTLLIAFTCSMFAQAGKSPSRTASLQALKTRPERTAYAETSRYDDVMEFLKAVAAVSPRVHLTTFGYSYEGRPLPLAVVGNVKDARPETVKATGKTRIYIQGNIHAGEVEGKEACLELIRALALGRHAAWLDSMVLLIGPIYNADGNERVNLQNRRGQYGPVGGMGQRETAQNYDLNRDFTKLDAPETRSAVSMLNKYDPHIAIDLHTTDGSAHAYHLTYAPPLHPATSVALMELMRNELLPAVTGAIKAKDGWDFYYYGNFSGGRPGSGGERAWFTTEPTPRYSANYWGLRNRLGILSETFSYLSFQDRIKVARRFVEEICDYARQHGDAIRRTVADADKKSIVGQEIALLTRPVKSAETVDILVGELGTEVNPYSGALMRRRLDVSKPEKMYQYVSFDASETTQAPRAYLLSPNLRMVVDRLGTHGVRFSSLAQPLSLKVEQFRIASTTRAERAYQGHQERTITGKWEPVEQAFPAGTILVPVDQPLGRLIVLLLEPRSEDSLAAWNLMDDVLEKEKPQIYPVYRTSEALPK